ncbi:MAG: histidine kinase [Prolixibacteraceae bacterium]|nr:histidine kinase [Prolixibacteraceae bacterium]
MNKLLFENRFPYRLFRHVIFFLSVVFAFSLILYVQNKNDNPWHLFKITLLNAFFFYSYAYITIFLLIPGYLLKQNIWRFILLFVLVGVALSALKLVVSNNIFYSFISPENIEREGIMNLRFIVVNTKDMTFIVALFCIGKYVKDYLYTESLHKKLEVQNKKAQGKLLQAQFDPHFLFNTINNLYALSLLNPAKTLEVIARIKTVLVYIIDESQKDFVKLEDEISMVKNYIQLEEMRYGKRLKIDFQTEGETKNLKVPPMVLFFLVENSFKHGSSLDAGTPWIKIRVTASSEKIELWVKNSKPRVHIENQRDEIQGMGFKNLKKRLDLTYSKKGYNLSVQNKTASFEVDLILKEKELETGRKKYR